MNSEIITCLNSKLDRVLENEDGFKTLLLLSREIDEVIKSITIKNNY